MSASFAKFAKRVLPLLLITTTALFAQSERATISGTVTDASGAAVPGARVTITNAATNQISNSSALGTGANANVGASAILDLTPLGPISFVPTTAGFGGSGTSTTPGATCPPTTSCALSAVPSPSSATASSRSDPRCC